MAIYQWVSHFQELVIFRYVKLPEETILAGSLDFAEKSWKVAGCQMEHDWFKFITGPKPGLLIILPIDEPMFSR